MNQAGLSQYRTLTSYVYVLLGLIKLHPGQQKKLRELFKRLRGFIIIIIMTHISVFFEVYIFNFILNLG